MIYCATTSVKIKYGKLDSCHKYLNIGYAAQPLSERGTTYQASQTQI